MKIVVIDYGSGNVKSVANALLEVKDDAQILISNRPADIKSANFLLLPGVGAFGDCMQGLNSVEELVPEIREQVLTKKKPFLGICVGMQVLASAGYENGEYQGLGFIEGKVKKITAQPGLKIPHMGWNEIKLKPAKHSLKKHMILQKIESGQHFYFANSYHFICNNKDEALAHVEYGAKLDVIVAKENIVGVQFHPEKSGAAGLKLLKNFLNQNS
jgi:glutamine amidotransferase